MPENTFDIVSKIDLAEVTNAIQQADKEIFTRFDLKGSNSKIALNEKAREIVKHIKDSKKKVQASIQGDLVRVSGKDRDTLQEIIAVLRGHDFGIDMQFTNYRSN